MKKAGLYISALLILLKLMKSDSKKVTKNFVWAEFDCNDGTNVPEEYKPNVKKLALALEIIRKEFNNVPIRINSAFRHPSYNHSIGGSPNSQHLTANAVDFVVKGISPSVVADKIEQLVSSGKIEQCGLGRYNTFTHLDFRGFRARW